MLGETATTTIIAVMRHHDVLKIGIAKSPFNLVRNPDHGSQPPLERRCMCQTGLPLKRARSLNLASLPPTIAGIPPERRAIRQQSAQQVGIWAGRGWRALRPVRQTVVLRKVTVE
jgi:hypothetical protein